MVALALPLQIVLLSGLSGSGKSVALAVLEDAEYYCIDNLPAQFLTQVVDFLEAKGGTRVAISVDARAGESVSDLPIWVEQQRQKGVDLRVLFLQARQDTLVKRFSETRRKHPLSDNQRTLAECIALEQTRLADLASLSQRIDTSDMLPNALRYWVKLLVSAPASQLSLSFQSFGFKHGLPLDADLVFDARVLTNPHYHVELRTLDGRNHAVIAFLEREAAAQSLLADIRGFVEKWIPGFVEDNRSYLTVAIGCTGGQHRSVYLVEALAAHFRQRMSVLVRHRELAGSHA